MKIQFFSPKSLKKGLTTMVLLLHAFSGSIAFGQQSETFKQKGFSLTFISQDKSLDPALKSRMVETFYEVYPKLVKEFNKKALKEVVFIVDTSYEGVAATSDGKVTFSSNWLKLHPEDIDVVTHEVMHIVQDYGNTNGPGWLTEGIADYVRYKFGVDNAGAHWSLPDYKAGQSYKNSYRITAKFLDWLETDGHKGMVKNMDKHLRDHTYSDELWRQYTGRTLDELWSKYTESQS
ncbi:basic secretory family protein [Arcticibacter tournemirensis]|nr:basic secretory family protein [Arcticibacter tournemirensis]